MIMDAVLMILPILTSAVLVYNFVTCMHRYQTVEDLYHTYHHLGPLYLPIGHQLWSAQYRCSPDAGRVMACQDAGRTLDVLPGHLY